MIYVLLSIVILLQVLCILLLGRAATWGRYNNPPARAGTPGHPPLHKGGSEERAPSEETVYPEWPNVEGDQNSFEKAFQEGMNSILNYDMRAARKAVQRDE